MKKGVRSSLVIAWLMAVMVAPSAFGGGGQHYPNGAEDSLSGVAPPPGLHMVNYVLYYDADEMDTPGGKMDIDARVWAEVFRVIYSSDKKILGGNYLCHLFIPYMDAELDPMGYSASSFADPIIDPLILAWHKPPYHAVAGIDIFVPIGDYDDNSPINMLGKNFWTFEPVFAITGLYETGWSWSLKLMYDFNTKNNEYFNPNTGGHSDLNPGDEFHFDYSLDYGVSKSCRVGACGYYYKQVEDDEVDGVNVAGEKGEVFAVGPMFMYSPSERLHLVAKAQFEVETENRPEGNAYWFKIIYSF